MTRCYVSEQIAKHCDEPDELECPKCGGGVTQDDDDYTCDAEECDGVIYAPDEDDFYKDDY
jgi:hypothetical protein